MDDLTKIAKGVSKQIKDLYLDAKIKEHFDERGIVDWIEVVSNNRLYSLTFSSHHLYCDAYMIDVSSVNGPLTRINNLTILYADPKFPSNAIDWLRNHIKPLVT